jgi:hypothetical protein
MKVVFLRLNKMIKFCEKNHLFCSSARPFQHKNAQTSLIASLTNALLAQPMRIAQHISKNQAMQRLHAPGERQNNRREKARLPG